MCASDNKVIYERGEIHKPDLIVIADDTLLIINPQTILEGVHENTIILIIFRYKPRMLFQDAIKGVKRIISISPADLPPNYRDYLSSIT
jgi:pyruvate ferredoxin oxidoreductase gamma subunit